MLSWRSPGHPQAGGAETFTFEILKRAVSRGHSVTWFSAASPGMPAHETVDGVHFLRAGRQWTVHLRAWRWLRRHRDDFDLVVDQINTLPFLTPWYVSAAKRRLLIFQTAREYWWRQTRGVFRLLAPVGYVLEPLYLRTYRKTLTLTISESTKADLIRFGIPAARIAIVPVAITGEAADRLPEKTGPFRLIVVGRLTPAKFVEEAIEAFSIVHQSIPECVLDLVGSGESRYRARLKRRVASLGLEKQVVFHGWQPDERKVELLTRAHVHVFTSHREGWGLTVNEAGALGTPTVGYDAPGVRDSIGDERQLADLRLGPGGLARRIVALHEDPSLYEEVRTRAWRFARELSYDKATDSFLEALEVPDA